MIGASEDPSKYGNILLRTLIEQGYRGAIHAVNPRGGSLLGRPFLRSLDEAQGPIDVALVVRPAEECPAVVREVARRGVGFAIVYAAGFAEKGSAGQASAGGPGGRRANGTHPSRGPERHERVQRPRPPQPLRHRAVSRRRSRLPLRERQPRLRLRPGGRGHETRGILALRERRQPGRPRPRRVPGLPPGRRGHPRRPRLPGGSSSQADRATFSTRWRAQPSESQYSSSGADAPAPARAQRDHTPRPSPPFPR